MLDLLEIDAAWVIAVLGRGWVKMLSWQELPKERFLDPEACREWIAGYQPPGQEPVLIMLNEYDDAGEELCLSARRDEWGEWRKMLTSEIVLQELKRAILARLA